MSWSHQRRSFWTSTVIPSILRRKKNIFFVKSISGKISWNWFSLLFHEKRSSKFFVVIINSHCCDKYTVYMMARNIKRAKINYQNSTTVGDNSPKGIGIIECTWNSTPSCIFASLHCVVVNGILVLTHISFDRWWKISPKSPKIAQYQPPCISTLLNY